MSVAIVSAFAQNPDGPKPVREKVYMDYFTKGSTVPADMRDMLRNNVIAGINKTNRVSIIDVDAEPTLKIDKSLTKSEDEVPTMDNVRLGALKTIGGKYVMTGDITSLNVVRGTNSEGKVYYEGEVIFTLKVIDTETGETKATKTYSAKGKDATENTGRFAAVKAVSTALMNEFVNDTFKVTGCLIEFGEMDKKGNPKEVYVNIGSSVGVSSGQNFDVYIEKTIGGSAARTKIAEITFKESNGEDVTLCKVTKGGDLIKAASAENKVMIVVSGKTNFFVGMFK